MGARSGGSVGALGTQAEVTLGVRPGLVGGGRWAARGLVGWGAGAEGIPWEAPEGLGRRYRLREGGAVWWRKSGTGGPWGPPGCARGSQVQGGAGAGGAAGAGGERRGSVRGWRRDRRRGV